MAINEDQARAVGCWHCAFYIDERCKLNPPQIGLMHPGNRGVTQLNDWPIVKEDDWCGQYKSCKAKVLDS